MQDELCGEKLTMTGIHPVSNLRPHLARRIHRTSKRDVQKPQNEHGNGQDQACAISTVPWFFGEKRVPQIATRVEQISESITMWRRSGKRQTPVLLWMALCSTRRRSSKVSPRIWKLKCGKKAAGHPLSTGMEKGIITDFAKKARSQLTKEGNFMAARALDFLVCGAINERHLLADGSIPNQFFCVRCEQRTVAARKHELWECPGNRLINHTHMKDSAHLVTLAQEFGTQIKFCLLVVICRAITCE